MKKAITTDSRHLIMSGALAAFSFMGIVSIFVAR